MRLAFTDSFAAAWFAVCRALRFYLFSFHTHAHVLGETHGVRRGSVGFCVAQYTHSRTHSICRVYGFTTPAGNPIELFCFVGPLSAAVIRHSRFTRSIQRRDAKPNANDLSCCWCCCLAHTHTEFLTKIQLKAKTKLSSAFDGIDFKNRLQWKTLC